jgi:hypothetical protein
MHFPITRASRAFVALAMASMYVAACGSPPTAPSAPSASEAALPKR